MRLDSTALFRIIDLDKTETNRELVREFIEDTLVAGTAGQTRPLSGRQKLPRTQSRHAGRLPRPGGRTGKMASSRQYQVIHRILAEGNFVLSVTEGTLGGEQASFYDLFRIAGGKIVEHWDTVEEVPPKSEWQNDNGKF
jgi:predicted SnoaL-like aldol condensation-catalyzing enzyme